MSEPRELPRAGNYNAVAIEKVDENGVVAYARWCLTKDDKKQVVAAFKLLDAPGGDIVYWYGSFSSTTMGKGNKTVAERTVESLRYMGLKGDDLMEVETQELNQVVSVVVEHDLYDPENPKLKIAWINAPGGGVMKIAKPMPEADKRKFAALMRASLAKVPEVDGERVNGTSAAAAPGTGGNPPTGGTAPATRTAPAAAQRPDEPPPITEDDIPF